MPDHSTPFMFSKSLLIKRQQKRLLFFRRSDRTRRAARISGRLRDAAGVRRAGKPHSGRRAKRVPREICLPTKLCPSPAPVTAQDMLAAPHFQKACQPPKACPPPETYPPAGHVRCPSHNPRSRRWTAKAAICPVPFAAPTRRSGIEARRRGASFSFPAVCSAKNPY